MDDVANSRMGLAHQLKVVLMIVSGNARSSLPTIQNRKKLVADHSMKQIFI